jgi:PAS domain S-box-containing protein
MDFESPIKPASPAPADSDLLKDTEDLLQAGTWTWKISTGTMEWSDGLYRLLGYARPAQKSELTIKNLLQHISETDHDHFIRQLDAAVESRSGFYYRHVLFTRDGKQLMVSSRGKALVEENEVTGIVCAMQDITETSGLREDSMNNNRLMDQYEVFLKFGTWEYSVVTARMTWSVGMYHLFGYDGDNGKELVIDEALYEKHIDPADYARGVTLKETTTNERNEYSWAYRITSATGEVKWLETYGRIIRDKNGQFTKTVGITRDITRLKLYEHSLEGKIRELNRSNAELEEFAYVASHDMQEPLRKLSTFSERLTTKFSDVLKDEGLLYINRILAATNNMRLLIENLLDFSRVVRTGEAFEDTDLNDVLRKVMADLEVAIEENQANIEVRDLPVIQAQAAQMKQLFSNLLSNALKFRKADVAPHIVVSCERLSARDAEKLGLGGETKYFKIEVRDNGIGFEQEYAERIFQIFQRLHGKAEYPGSGIGLAICKKIVDYHNGLIYGTGQINEGAVITIILPEKQ